MANTTVVAKYVGSGGEFLYQIPGRDLTIEDWAALDKKQQKLVANSPLYEMVEKKAPVLAEPKPGAKEGE